MESSSSTRAFPLHKKPSCDAERYLLLVRAASRTVPNVMTMATTVPLPQPRPAAAPPTPVPSLPVAAAAVPAPALPLDPPYDEAWIAASLSTFGTLREHIAWWVARTEAGLPLPAISASLRRACGSASAWRELCLGRYDAVQAVDDNVWVAEEEEEEEEACGEEGEEWLGEENAGEEDEEAGDEAGTEEAGVQMGEGLGNGLERPWEGSGEAGVGMQGGAGAAPEPQRPPPLPPLLSCLVGLDQVSITRALARGVQAARARGPFSPLPPSEAAWLYALLAALQLPFVGATAATLRELFLLQRDHRRALARAHQHHLLAIPSLLCILAGRYFGQAWE